MQAHPKRQVASRIPVEIEFMALVTPFARIAISGAHPHTLHELVSLHGQVRGRPHRNTALEMKLNEAVAAQALKLPDHSGSDPLCRILIQGV